jgi:23S rRNA-/tRNA-specific pseudouridylate synthase
MNKDHILYNDNNFTIINKPTNIIMYSINQKKKTLIYYLLHYFPKAKINNHKNGIIHRIDKDTSGLIIYSKKKKIYNFISNQFKNRKIIKKYLVLTSRSFNRKQANLITVHKRAKRNRTKYTTDVKNSKCKKINFKIAHSKINTILTKKNISLLNIRIITGRIHQIRAQLLNIDYPIIGDNLYKKRNIKKQNNKTIYLIDSKKQALHSFFLMFNFFKKKIFKINSKIPNDLKNLFYYFLKNF